MRLIAMVLCRLRLSPLLRSLGVRVPWTFEEIERQWFGSAHLHWDRADVRLRSTSQLRYEGTAGYSGRSET